MSNSKMRKAIGQTIKRIFTVILMFLGCISFIALALSFTGLPYRGIQWLGTDKLTLNEKPEYIVMLGGGGMPGESNLIRAFYVVKAARMYPESQIIISHPGDISDSLSTCRLIARELIEKGIDSRRIIFENQGVNTRSQALLVRNFKGEDLREKPVLLISSASHIKRAILCFRKAGFRKVAALSAFQQELEADLSQLDQQPQAVPPVGLDLRYNFWNRLQDEITFVHELTALAYYWLKGWI